MKKENKITVAAMTRAGELFEACVKVSDTTKYDVFFDYSAHVSSIDIGINDGSKDYQQRDNRIENFSIDLKSPFEKSSKYNRNINDAIKTVLSYLKKETE
jgi:hypothetical protein